MSVLASFSDSIAGNEKKLDAAREPHQGRPGLGTFPGLRLGSGCALTHGTKIPVPTE